MLREFLDLFGGEGAGHRAVPDLRVAVAALLVQAARMDDHFDPAERAAIRRVLAQRFGLDQVQLADIMLAAERAADDAADLFRFTHVVTEKLELAERVQVIEMLWEVAYADGQLDPEEDMLIRRIAGLIDVEDKDRGEARRRILDRLPGTVSAMQD